MMLPEHASRTSMKHLRHFAAVLGSILALASGICRSVSPIVIGVRSTDDHREIALQAEYSENKAPKETNRQSQVYKSARLSLFPLKIKLQEGDDYFTHALSVTLYKELISDKLSKKKKFRTAPAKLEIKLLLGQSTYKIFVCNLNNVNLEFDLYPTHPGQEKPVLHIANIMDYILGKVYINGDEPIDIPWSDSYLIKPDTYREKPHFLFDKWPDSLIMNNRLKDVYAKIDPVGRFKHLSVEALNYEGTLDEGNIYGPWILKDTGRARQVLYGIHVLPVAGNITLRAFPLAGKCLHKAARVIDGSVSLSISPASRVLVVNDGNQPVAVFDNIDIPKDAITNLDSDRYLNFKFLFEVLSAQIILKQQEKLSSFHIEQHLKNNFSFKNLSFSPRKKTIIRGGNNIYFEQSGILDKWQDLSTVTDTIILPARANLENPNQASLAYMPADDYTGIIAGPFPLGSDVNAGTDEPSHYFLHAAFTENHEKKQLTISLIKPSPRDTVNSLLLEKKKDRLTGTPDRFTAKLAISLESGKFTLQNNNTAKVTAGQISDWESNPETQLLPGKENSYTYAIVPDLSLCRDVLLDFIKEEEISGWTMALGQILAKETAFPQIKTGENHTVYDYNRYYQPDHSSLTDGLQALSIQVLNGLDTVGRGARRIHRASRAIMQHPATKTAASVLALCLAVGLPYMPRITAIYDDESAQEPPTRAVPHIMDKFQNL